MCACHLSTIHQVESIIQHHQNELKRQLNLRCINLRPIPSVLLYTYMDIWVYAYVYIHIHTRKGIYVHTNQIQVWRYTCVCMYMYMYMYVNMYMYLYSIYTNMYMYHIYTHPHASFLEPTLPRSLNAKALGLLAASRRHLETSRQA